MKFCDKVVVITGAGQGLGACLAEVFAAKGAKVGVLSRTESKVVAVVNRIRTAGGIAEPFVCDVSKSEQVKTTFRNIEEVLGPVDILVNNAVAHILKPLMEMSEEEWERQIETNLNGTFYCCKAVLPNMVARRYGKIINISSSAVKNIFPGFGGYAASKCGVVSLTKSLGDEMKHYDINVNAINLGMTCTEDVLRRLEEKDADEAITIQPKDMLQVKDVSEAVLFLASDASKTIMGTDIDLFGKKA